MEEVSLESMPLAGTNLGFHVTRHRFDGLHADQFTILLAKEEHKYERK